MHPLSPDLTQLSDQELNNKLTELNKKINMSTRMNNYAITQQLINIRDDYQFELSVRNRKQLEEYSKKIGKGFDDIIDIN